MSLYSRLVIAGAVLWMPLLVAGQQPVRIVGIVETLPIGAN
jgi:hypothetical protein